QAHAARPAGARSGKSAAQGSGAAARCTTPAGGAIMSTLMMRCCRAYRRMARAFPHRYRAICGDGLEQLGEDLVPRVWQQQGVVGLIRLFGDVALRLPREHFSAWADSLREATMAGDFFE